MIGTAGGQRQGRPTAVADRDRGAVTAFAPSIRVRRLTAFPDRRSVVKHGAWTGTTYSKRLAPGHLGAHEGSRVGTRLGLTKVGTLQCDAVLADTHLATGRTATVSATPQTVAATRAGNVPRRQ